MIWTPQIKSQYKQEWKPAMEVVLSLNGFTKKVNITEPRRNIRYCLNKRLKVEAFDETAPVEVDTVAIEFEYENSNLYCADIYELLENQNAEKFKDRRVNKLLSQICGLEREIRRLKSGQRK